MRRPVRDPLCLLAFVALLAANMPARAADRAAAPSSEEASCRVPPIGGSTPVHPRADLGALRAQLAAAEHEAHAAGLQTLNTRGYNYVPGHGELEPAALDFEVRGR